LDDGQSGISAGAAASTAGGATRNAEAGAGLGHYGRAIEIIEINRTAWFEIISHFNALFQDSVGAIPASAIVGVWLWCQYRKFSDDLLSVAAKIDDGSSLRAVLEQCLHFSSRMSGLGCDFSDHIVSDFGDLVVNKFSGICSIATKRLCAMITTERFSLEVDGVKREQVVPLYLLNEEDEKPKAEAAVADSATTADSSAAQLAPPAIIMNFPPLAHFINGILEGLNLVRDCPLVELSGKVIEALIAQLDVIVQTIERESKRIKDLGSKYTKVKHFSSIEKIDEILLTVLLNEVYPHILSCYSVIFPGVLATDQTFGVTRSSYQIMRKYTEKLENKSAV
jgi:hypothetical protein